MNPQYIDSSEKMDAVLDQLCNAPLIAVDTEFQRETTYYPHLALVQVATDTVVVCIDPLAFDAKTALKKILLNDTAIKIFHSCSQDMEVLFYYLGETPGKIYDTQIAYSLLTDKHQAGYAAVVDELLGIQLDKSQTRTNWLQRPLTPAQIQYAGDDVLYLYQLHEILDQQLQEKNRKSWFDEECDVLADNKNFQVDSRILWKRVKGATRLSRSSLVFIQSIAEWREQLAALKDRTRRKILHDETVIQLAIELPENIAALDKILTDNRNRHHRFDLSEKQSLLDIIKTTHNIPEEEWPDNRFSRLDNQQKTTLKTLQQIVNDKAGELGMSATAICSRKDLEQLILIDENTSATIDNSSDTALNVMNGWRYQVVGKLLQSSLTDPAHTDADDGI